MINLDELEKLHLAATPGPWACDRRHPTSGGVRYVHPAGRHSEEIAVLYGGDDIEGNAPDAALIAATRNALPTLIAELRAARENDATASLADLLRTIREEERERAAEVCEGIADDVIRYGKSNAGELVAVCASRIREMGEP